MEIKDPSDFKLIVMMIMNEWRPNCLPYVKMSVYMQYKIGVGAS